MAIDPNSSAAAAAANPPRPPPPPQPPSSSATRPVSPQIVHPIPIPVRLPPSSSSSSSPSTWAPYPVASSGGRGFRPLPSDQTVTVANPAATAAFSHPSAAHVVRSLPLPYIQQPTPPQQQKQYNHPNHVPSKGLAVSNAQPPKVASSSSVPETNGYKDMREKCRDDMFSVVRDRKVRIMEGRSLYAHCRSWLRNGFHEESQPLYGSAVRSLPKPSPIPMANTNLQKKEGEHEAEGGIDDTEEDEESVEHLSTEDLFKRHVKRAKKVRARLREVRLKRIARYKSRLALLLPPLVEQFRNDASAGGT